MLIIPFFTYKRAPEEKTPDMRLRTIIFLILFALGVIPIITLVAINLSGHIERHEVAERQRSAAQLASEFTTLNARLAGLEKTMRHLAHIPLVIGQVRGRPVDFQDTTDLDHLARLIGQLTANEVFVREIQILDMSGRQRVRLRRNHEGLLVTLPPAQLRDLSSSPYFTETLRLPAGKVKGFFRHLGSGSLPSHSELTLAMPLDADHGPPSGIVAATLDADRFFDKYRESFWVHEDGDILNTPHRLQASSVPRPDPRFPGVLARTQAPFIWDDPPSGFKIAWLPVRFSGEATPVMWLGNLIDRSGAEEWKRSLVVNILMIVSATMVVVAIIASLIATKVDRIKEAILTGLDRILNRGEDDVSFSWTGPREVVNLAEELTSLARRFSATRKARQEAENALKESETKFRNLTASAQDAIVMMDHHGNISYWNKAATEIFGYSEEEALGKPLHTLISPRLSETGHRESAANPSAADDGPIRETIELITRHKEGSPVPIELSLSEARIKDRWHSIWIIRDISERKRREEQAREQQQQLIQADKMISLGLLVSGVAHEINNPNSIAMLNTAMMTKVWESVRPVLEKHYQEHGDFLVAGIEYSEMRHQVPRLLAELDDSIKRIKGIVQDLKDYARKDTSAHMDLVDINEVVRTAARLMRNRLNKATSRFVMELGQDLPRIKGSSQRLEQVVINLLQNSCEALTSKDQEIRITTRRLDDATVELEVYDQGCGIPEASLHQVTDPFFTTKRDLGGTGLGLSVSAGIVKEHGGVMLFRSEPGKYTSAMVRFPVPRDPSSS